MFQNYTKRQELKNLLIRINIVLAIVFLGLFLYGMFEVRPQNTSTVSERGQYYEFNARSLPSDNDVSVQGVTQ